MSAMVKDNEDPLPALFYNYQECKTVPVPELIYMIEEADIRIIPHIKWEIYLFSAKSGVLVVSQDTNVLVLLLLYMKSFKLLGLTELYMQLGKGDNKRCIPLHLLHSKLGDDFCKALLKCHLGTRCNYLSKIGTKHSALLAQPQLSLTTFGESAILDDTQVQEAEKYLVKVINSSSNARSFDELRAKIWTKTNSVLHLPPTSCSIIHGHVPRWY